MFILFIVLYLLANTAAKLSARVFAKNTVLDPHSANFYSLVPSYLIGVALALTQLEQSILEGVEFWMVAISLLLGILLIFTQKASMLIQKHTEAAPNAVIKLISNPVTIIISTIVFNEHLEVNELIGMLLILAGAGVAMVGGKKLRNIEIGYYDFTNVLLSIFVGGYVVWNSYLMNETSLTTSMILFSGLQHVPMVVYNLSRNRMKPTRSDKKNIVLMSTAFALNVFFFWLAVELEGIALVSSVGSFRLITIALGAFLFLKERSNMLQKLIGAVLATVGLLVIA